MEFFVDTAENPISETDITLPGETVVKTANVKCLTIYSIALSHSSSISYAQFVDRSAQARHMDGAYSWLHCAATPSDVSGADAAANDASFYLIRSVLFIRAWDNEAAIASRADVQRLNLITLLTTNRESTIFPFEDRAKCIVNPRLVAIMGIHFPVGFLGDSRGVHIDKEHALVHHYRSDALRTPYNVQPTAVHDPVMLKYADAIINRFVERMNIVNESFLDHLQGESVWFTNGICREGLWTSRR